MKIILHLAFNRAFSNVLVVACVLEGESDKLRFFNFRFVHDNTNFINSVLVESSPTEIVFIFPSLYTSKTQHKAKKSISSIPKQLLVGKDEISLIYGLVLRN